MHFDIVKGTKVAKVLLDENTYKFCKMETEIYVLISHTETNIHKNLPIASSLSMEPGLFLFLEIDIFKR